MISKSLQIPLAEKANAKLREAVEAALAEGRRLSLEDINRIAGWDADAKFAQARARLRVLPGKSVTHNFHYDIANDRVVHLFEVRQ